MIGLPMKISIINSLLISCLFNVFAYTHPPVIIETERLTLREFTINDLDKLVAEIDMILSEINSKTEIEVEL